MYILFEAIAFAYFLALPIGVGSVKMLQNGINKSPKHAFWTGEGMNVIDCFMFVLYYFGLSHLLSIYSVKIVIYNIGMFVLLKLSIGCFKHTKINLQNNVSIIHAKITESLKDGILVSFVPSSLVYWTATYGAFLSNKTDNKFFIACIGLLIGFFFCNLTYSLIAYIIKKYANQTIIKWVNIVSGTILFGFAIYFFIQTILLII